MRFVASEIESYQHFLLYHVHMLDADPLIVGEDSSYRHPLDIGMVSLGWLTE